jgi:putative tricarboxylic transport membrane protein
LPAPAWRPLIAILAAIGVFAALFSSLGLIAACVGSVLVAGTATGPVRWGRLVLFGPALATFSALLFVKGLGLPLQLWPSFLVQYWAQHWPPLGAW